MKLRLNWKTQYNWLYLSFYAGVQWLLPFPSSHSGKEILVRSPGDKSSSTKRSHGKEIISGGFEVSLGDISVSFVVAWHPRSPLFFFFLPFFFLSGLCETVWEVGGNLVHFIWKVSHCTWLKESIAFQNCFNFNHINLRHIFFCCNHILRLKVAPSAGWRLLRSCIFLPLTLDFVIYIMR